MLIGVDASRAVAAKSAGVGHYSAQLIAALLTGSSYRFRLYANGAQPPAWAQSNNAEWRDIPWPRLWTHIRLSTEMVMHSPDVLFIPAHVLPPLHPRASVVTVHDVGYLYYPQQHPLRQRFYLRLSTLWSCRASKLLLVDSQATIDDLKKSLSVPTTKMRLAYPGVSPLFYPRQNKEIDTIRQRYHLPDRYLLYLGTIQPRKNLSRLLQAHAQVPEAPILVLAGGRGWLSGPIIAQIEASGERVRYLDYVPDNDLPAMISGAQALLLVSLYEGFGLPALEAMACAVPVLASRTSSLPEVIGDSGLLVDPLSNEEIASGIKRLCTDAEYAHALGIKGQMRAQRFTWQRCAEVALAAFEQAYEN